MDEMLKPVLNAVKKTVCDLFGDKVDLVVVGSTARNEFTGYQENEKIRAYSDVEFILISKLPKIVNYFKRGELNKRLDAIVKKYFVDTGYQGIDIWIITENQFRSGKTVFFHEAKANGIGLISGLGCFKLDQINKDIDHKDLREIIIHRAINMANGIRKFCDDSDRLNYVISRNFLDILTVYSSFEGLQKFTYRDRLNSASKMNVEFSQALLSELQLSLSHKLDPENVRVLAPEYRLPIYWKELTKLAEYVDIWSDSNQVNFHGLNLYLHKLKYWLFNNERFEFQYAFICQKKSLLRLILDSASDNPFLRVSKKSYKKFGIKVSAVEKNNLLDDISDIAKFNYPYLAKKSG